MPSGPMAHVCLMVNDLDKAIEDWQKILGVLDPGQLEEQLVRYDEFEGGEDEMRWVTFVANGTEIQLMEPAPDTPLGRRLAKHGEHVHHICFTTGDVAGSAKKLADSGLSVDVDNTYSDPGMPWQEWTWVLPDSAHGVLVEIARPYKAVEGKWADGSVA
jgi:methylmalonyl-CoA/ethylmalonyl-CoA epimerase